MHKTTSLPVLFLINISAAEWNEVDDVYEKKDIPVSFRTSNDIDIMITVISLQNEYELFTTTDIFSSFFCRWFPPLKDWGSAQNSGSSQCSCSSKGPCGKNKNKNPIIGKILGCFRLTFEHHWDYPTSKPVSERFLRSAWTPSPPLFGSQRRTKGATYRWSIFSKLFREAKAVNSIVAARPHMTDIGIYHKYEILKGYKTSPLKECRLNNSGREAFTMFLRLSWLELKQERFAKCSLPGWSRWPKSFLRNPHRGNEFLTHVIHLCTSSYGHRLCGEVQ